MRLTHVLSSGIAVVALFAAGCGPSRIQEGGVYRDRDRVVSVAFAPDGKTLASKTLEGTIRLLDVGKSLQSRAVLPGPQGMSPIGFSPDGRYLACDDPSSHMNVWDVATTQRHSSHLHPERPEVAIGCYSVTYGWGMAYSRDGRKLATGGSDLGDNGFVTVWDLQSGEGRDYGDDSSPVFSVAFDRKGESIFTGGSSGKINQWSLADGRSLKALDTGLGTVHSLAISPDGTALCAGGTAGVGLWTLPGRGSRSTFGGHASTVFSVAFHPKGSVIASADLSGNILIWDPLALETLARVKGHDGRVLALSFSPDGLSLASGGADGQVRLWRLNKE